MAFKEGSLGAVAFRKPQGCIRKEAQVGTCSPSGLSPLPEHQSGLPFQPPS